MQATHTPKYQLVKRLGSLKTEFATWRPHYQDLSRHLLPMSGRFFVQDRNKGQRRMNEIYDSTGTRALRVLGAGMMSGATSPARPWFRFALADRDLMDYGSVKLWLNRATAITLDIFQRSNTYRALHSCYEELGCFGTHAMIYQPDFENFHNLYNSTCGEFFLGKNAYGSSDTLGREFQMQVSAMVDPIKGFGYENCSNSVRNMYDQGSLDSWVTVCHMIEPRYDRDPSMKDSKNMAWGSYYFEYQDRGSSDTFLRESGYKRFPALTPRWAVSGGDIYGSSPGMEALGDIKQLQHEQLRKAQGIDYMTKPPLQLPTSMKGREHETLPGGTAYVDQTTPGGGIRSQFDVRLDLNHLLADIQDVRSRINGCFYADLFLMLANQVESRMTATEVAERHEEKLLMLGPVLERIHNELLAPLVDLTFDRMIETGVLPPPPPELQGQDLNVEFVSMLAQAQKAVQTNSIDRFAMSLGQIAQVKPEVLDKFDSDKWADIYSDALGVDPELVVPDSKVALIRKDRAQQMQAAQQQQAMLAASQTAKNASQTDTSGKNGATDIMNAFTGYSTPQSTDATQGA